MPGIAFHGLLDQAVQVSLAAVPAKAGGVGQDARPSPLITLVAAPLNCPTCTRSCVQCSLLFLLARSLTHSVRQSLTHPLIHSLTH